MLGFGFGPRPGGTRPSAHKHTHAHKLLYYCAVTASRKDEQTLFMDVNDSQMSREHSYLSGETEDTEKIYPNEGYSIHA